MSACAEPLCSLGLAVPHGFFTRRGGVSMGPYASLNCSLSGNDSRDAVLENRARAARTVGARCNEASCAISLRFASSGNGA